MGFEARGVLAAGAVFTALATTMATAAERELTFAHVLEQDHPYHLMAERFKEELEGLDVGLTVEIYPAGQLGDERTLLEGLQTGSIDISTITSALTANFVEEFQVFSLPFIFRDTDHLFAVMDSEIGEELAQALRRENFVALGYGYGGVRDMYTHDPVQTLEDLQGKRIRTMENTMIVDTWDALGAEPSAISWGDVYVSLQQRLVDGAEGTGVSYRSMGFDDLAENFTQVNYIFSWHNVLMSEMAYEDLTDEQRDAVRKAAGIAIAYQRDTFLGQESELLDELRGRGVNVLDVEDMDRWRDAVQAVYERHAEDVGGLEWIDRIRKYDE